MASSFPRGHPGLDGYRFKVSLPPFIGLASARAATSDEMLPFTFKMGGGNKLGTNKEVILSGDPAGSPSTIYIYSLGHNIGLHGLKLGNDYVVVLAQNGVYHRWLGAGQGFGSVVAMRTNMALRRGLTSIISEMPGAPADQIWQRLMTSAPIPPPRPQSDQTTGKATLPNISQYPDWVNNGDTLVKNMPFFRAKYEAASLIPPFACNISRFKPGKLVKIIHHSRPTGAFGEVGIFSWDSSFSFHAAEVDQELYVVVPAESQGYTRYFLWLENPELHQPGELGMCVAIEARGKALSQLNKAVQAVGSQGDEVAVWNTMMMQDGYGEEEGGGDGEGDEMDEADQTGSASEKGDEEVEDFPLDPALIGL